jgi:hypothetical protein
LDSYIGEAGAKSMVAAGSVLRDEGRVIFTSDPHGRRR